jgi:hypothetical protein
MASGVMFAVRCWPLDNPRRSPDHGRPDRHGRVPELPHAALAAAPHHRLAAVVPAAVTIYISGEEGIYRLLILSQVVLSLQLPFAVIP